MDVRARSPLVGLGAAHRARQQDERRPAGDDWREDGLVTTEIGTAIEPQNVLRRFEQPSAGTHTQVVQDQLGHSSYAITADIYSHVDPAQRREAVDRLDQALRW